MSDADRNNVSNLVPYLDQLPDPRARIDHAVPPRNPLRGVFLIHPH